MTISSAVAASARSKVVGIETVFKDLRASGVRFLPQRVAVVGQGATASVYATTKTQVTSALQAATLYGFGSPIHLAVKQLLPTNGDGVGTIPVTVYPLEDAGSGVIATGDITPSGTATAAGSYRVAINGILSEEFTVAVGDVVADVVTAITAAIAATLSVPVTAVDGTTTVNVISKWLGASANDIFMEIVGDDVTGISFAISQLSGGAVNPTVDDALAQIGDVWETMVVNCLEIADTVALEAYSTFGLGRWGATTKKPLVVFTGNTEADASTAITISDARKTDQVNSQVVAPGSVNLPLMVAARQVARIAVLANDNPPHDYGGLAATGLTPGTDGEQWDYLNRELAFKGGSSTVVVSDGVINLSDILTFYHPTGDETPAYQYVVDIVKLMNILYNFDLEFTSAKWAGAPLIPDGQPTVNPSAKSPKVAVAAANGIIDNLAAEALISDPETAKASTVAEIDASNPKRLNLSTTLQLSGNSNVISITINYGFYFGGA